MKLSEIAKAVAAVSSNHAILIYGPPKSGKTRLAGQSAKIPEIKNVYFFSLENGHETLIHECGLTEEEMDKVTVYKIQDTTDEPIAVETMLKAMSSRNDIKICDTHGRVDCAICTKAKRSFTPFNLSKCTHSDIVIIDTGTKLGDSALAGTMIGRDSMAKPGWDEFGIQGKWLTDILSVVEQAVFTNFIVTCHALFEKDDDGTEKVFPLMGTRPFSLRVAGKFGTVVYLDKKLNKHVGGSSSTYRGNVLTGSRVGAKLEAAKEINIRSILVDTGIIRPGQIEEVSVKDPINPDKKEEVVSQEQVVMQDPKGDAKPMGLAAMIAKKKAEALARKEAEKV